MSKIEKEQYYNLYELAEMGVFPWLAPHDPRKYSELINADREAKDVMKTYVKKSVTGEPTGRRYKIKGANVIRFIEMFESGEYRPA